VDAPLAVLSYVTRRCGQALLTFGLFAVAVAILVTGGARGGGSALDWLAAAARLDFGRASDNSPVIVAIVAALPATALLVLAATLIGLVAGYGGGLLLALTDDSSPRRHRDTEDVSSSSTVRAWSVKSRSFSPPPPPQGEPGGMAPPRPPPTRGAWRSTRTDPANNAQALTVRERGRGVRAFSWYTVVRALAMAAEYTVVRALAMAADVCQGVPVFWLGGVLVVVLSVELGLFPPGGIADPALPAFGTVSYLDLLRARPALVLGDLLGRLALPALTLALAGLATRLRLVSTALPPELCAPYARVARATGLSRRRLVWRAARPALPVIMSGAVGNLAPLAGAVVLVEYLFGWPGLGLLAYHAARAGDTATLGTLLFLFGFIVIVAGLVGDIAAAWADPRLRSHGTTP